MTENKTVPLKIEELILFVLYNTPRNIGVKKLNKLVFLLEFTYIFEHGSNLTNNDYAAIPMGPVIDDYKELFISMCKKGLLEVNSKSDKEKIDYNPLGEKPDLNVDLGSFLKETISRYIKLNPKQLEDLTHNLDSYNITVSENNGRMNAKIDKELACLDTSLSFQDA